MWSWPLTCANYWFFFQQSIKNLISDLHLVHEYCMLYKSLELAEPYRGVLSIMNADLFFLKKKKKEIYSNTHLDVNLWILTLIWYALCCNVSDIFWDCFCDWISDRVYDFCSLKGLKLVSINLLSLCLAKIFIVIL